ncbi:RecT-like ssDNA annealing protein [Geobacillus phage GBK2]|uniref:RecT-like ssDNA annealing protein n=1 Tax=Geobacillus phage GBK2 TaxID=1458842 RepID=UPI0003F1E041|nr:RecT-like ssDNA annealing protein [Geobacillus phage GBK2]AHJ88637.1 RecT [Geobacillus phage GBK2]
MTTKKQSELKNQLAAKANNAQMQEKPKTPQQVVGEYIKTMMPSIQQVLPKHLDAERMARLALNVIRTNPLLLQCNMPSLLGAVLEAAKLGLEPGLLGQAYIVPYKNHKASEAAGKDVYEAQFIIGYRGLIDLVRRSGQVSTIAAHAVHENDVFEYEYGLNDKLVHKPALKDRGAVIAYYAIAKMKDGGYSFLVMSKEDIEKHRDKYSKAKKYSPWVDEFDAMAKKTVLRQLIKYLPISVEFLAHDEQNGVNVYNEVVDDKDVINVDYETGEILEPQTIEVLEVKDNE